MLFTLFLLNTFLLLLSLINFATIRKAAPLKEIGKKVTILLPVRNEESNITRILNELISQRGLQNFSIIVINDASTDRTLALANDFRRENLSVIEAPALPQGWIGKVNALQAGLKVVPDSDFIISIDADVHFSDDAIARAIATIEELNLDFISPYPRQIAESWEKRLVQPLLRWSWMSTVVLRLAEKFPMRSTVVCNGQFLVMRRDSLLGIGGFEAVSHQVLDDIELGRAFIAGGYRGVVIDGSEIASTRMYSSFREVRSGYAKSLHSAFGSIFGSAIAALFIFATSVLPLLFVFSGNILAIAALSAIIGTRFISAYSSRSSMRDSFLHPISASLFIYLLYFSWRKRGQTQWKGRTI